jgi:hypothetical protein
MRSRHALTAPLFFERHDYTRPLDMNSVSPRRKAARDAPRRNLLLVLRHVDQLESTNLETVVENSLMIDPV